MNLSKGIIFKNKKIKNDLILIGAILLLAAASLLLISLSRSKGAFAVAYIDGKVAVRLALNEDGEYLIDCGNGDYNEVIIRGGEVSVFDANCRDKICVHHRAVSHDGESIICLPHKLVIMIEGSTDE
ncbi:MAG: NusG domain II-containing protein [Clostridia bacterium]|nr:NusG domain II-containing protein [Clostridia bacterium]